MTTTAPYLTISGLARLKSTSPQHVRNAIARGDLPSRDTADGHATLIPCGAGMRWKPRTQRGPVKGKPSRKI